MRTYSNPDQQERVVCLMAIENLTSCDNHQTLRICIDQQLLPLLQDLAENYPLANCDKMHVMGIYGNLLDSSLSGKGTTGGEGLYGSIFLACIEENYDH